MENEQQVYYDPKAQVIFTVKRILKRYVVIGGCYSPYLNDARTSHTRFRMSNAYFKYCVSINNTSKLLRHDGIGFRLRDDNQYHKVHSNPNYTHLAKESERIIRAHGHDAL